MSMIALAERLRKRIREKHKANHAEMDKGKAQDEYMKLVGRNLELREMNDWIVEIVQQIDSETGETDL